MLQEEPEPTQRHGFEQLAASLSVADRVSFTGDVSDADLPAYYRAADVHVCPSTAAAEAFSLVTLEAAASGIPTVASSLPGVRTVVVHGETGVHVAPSDPVSLGLVLESLVNGPARTALGRAARARAEAHFRWEPAIIRLEQTYREVVGSVRGTEA
jgi:glycosyltransferase involved in cell wall biosynthesis